MKFEKEIKPIDSMSIPDELLSLQENFSKAIREPVSFATGFFVFQKENYPADFVKTVSPRGDQGPEDRIAIYNEQYWYRLFSILQEDFPLLAAVLGFWEFNQLASEYLSQYPSRSPFLDFLPTLMEEFLSTHTRFANPLNQQIAQLDLAAYKSLFSPPGKKFSAENLSAKPIQSEADSEGNDEAASEAEALLNFQPGLTLFEEDWNLMEWRIKIVEGGMGQVERLDATSFIPQKGFWILFQKEGRRAWRATDALGFRLLKALKTPLPLGEACSLVAEGMNEEELEAFVRDLPNWFAMWTADGFFAG